jgi:hypothetical protein
MGRSYYSQRQGMRPTRVTLDQLKRVVGGLYSEWRHNGLFQEWFGYACVDAGNVSGLSGEDPEAYVFRVTLSDRLWPVPEHVASWTESELFDALEFIWEHVSAGEDGNHHDWINCGWHYRTFDSQRGQERVRADLNPVLALYDSGYELTIDGEISKRLAPHIQAIAAMPLPQETPERVAVAVHRAIRLYRQRDGGEDEWREAARELAGAFQYLRPQIQTVLTHKDDDTIFQLANQFNIRHSDPGQIARYDPRWLRWIVEIYLSTLFFCFDLLGWKAPPPPVAVEPEIPDADPPSTDAFDPDEIPF